MNWTQPICGECFARRSPDKQPARLRFPDEEKCCDCGKQTSSGIFVRVDPKTVAHPS